VKDGAQRPRPQVREKKQRPPKPPRDERIRALFDLAREILTEQPAPAIAWDWLHWKAWARSQAHAKKLAIREGVRLTKIGRDLYGWRADLDELAARNVVVIAAEGANDTDEEDPEVLAAFAGGRR
jgi:hypothetical protein